MGVPLEVKAEEMDAFNECLENFKNEVLERCPKFRILGLFVGVPNAEGAYGCMVALGPGVSYEGLAQITSEMGVWMTKFGMQ